MAIDDAFNKTADYYDAWVRNAIPCYDELVAVALENIPFAAQDRIRVLDLGAGTGLFSWQVLEKFPQASFTLVDLAEQMMEMAKQKFSGHEDRVEYVVGDYGQGLPAGQYDLVISRLSIHHLDEPEKRHLFKEIYGRLKPGGAFINADQLKAPSRHFEKLYWETWLKKVRQTQASEEQIQDSIKRRKELDKDATMAEQLSWLHEAGFDKADCLYHHYFVGVFFAQK